MVTVAVPADVPEGIRKFTCVEPTKNNGDGRSTPAASRTTTRVPASVVGSGTVVATCVLVDRPVPNAATMASLAMAEALKDAAETVESAREVVSRYTPRP